MSDSTQIKWQIWFSSPEMAARGHIQAGRVFKHYDRAVVEAAKINTWDGWHAEVRTK